MKIYVSHASAYDYRTLLYQPIKESDLWREHTIILPHDTSTKPQSSYELIRSCNLLIAECSLPSTGQGIELGWAHQAGVPIVCMHNANSVISEAIKTVTDQILAYSDGPDLVAKLKDVLGTIRT